MAIPYVACMALVASLYHLPPRVLPAIQAVEGGRVGLVHPNANGTDDLGLMQVNTIWLVPLARYTGLAPLVVRTRLLDEPCFNIAAAGAVMATYLAEERGVLMRAVGDYHSHTPMLNEQYQIQVVYAARGLFVRRGPPGRTGFVHRRFANVVTAPAKQSTTRPRGTSRTAASSSG